MTETTLASPSAERPSLRERKREQTWNAIHEAAAAQAFAHEQLSNVSIDAIAAEANVSPRTFFNYFASKEDAIIGQKDPVVSAALAESFTLSPGDDLIEKTTTLLLAVFRSTMSGGGTQRRRELMGRHPELLRRGTDHVEAVKTRVQDLVADRLLALPPWQGLANDSVEVADAALMIVSTAGAVMRVAVPKLLEASGPDDELAVLRHVNAVFHQVAGGTQ